MNINEFELKLANGKNIVWTGTSEIDAAHRYVDCNPTETVIASATSNQYFHRYYSYM